VKNKEVNEQKSWGRHQDFEIYVSSEIFCSHWNKWTCRLVTKEINRKNRRIITVP